MWKARRFGNSWRVRSGFELCRAEIVQYAKDGRLPSLALCEAGGKGEPRRKNKIIATGEGFRHLFECPVRRQSLARTSREQVPPISPRRRATGKPVPYYILSRLAHVLSLRCDNIAANQPRGLSQVQWIPASKLLKKRHPGVIPRNETSTYATILVLSCDPALGISTSNIHTRKSNHATTISLFAGVCRSLSAAFHTPSELQDRLKPRDPGQRPIFTGGGVVLNCQLGCPDPSRRACRTAGSKAANDFIFRGSWQPSSGGTCSPGIQFRDRTTTTACIEGGLLAGTVG